MSDSRVIMMSTSGYQQLVNPENGKGLHWTSDIRAELPIKLQAEGDGAQRPMTLPSMF